MSASLPTELGTFEVTVDAGTVAAFCTATGLAPAVAEPPWTYPMRWLVLPKVRRAILSLAPDEDLIPVHEGQSFDYDRPLTIGESYTLALSGHREIPPDRLVIRGTVQSADRTIHARIETTLRLFSRRASAA